jgi:hypothetical protein
VRWSATLAKPTTKQLGDAREPNNEQLGEACKPNNATNPSRQEQER